MNSRSHTRSATTHQNGPVLRWVPVITNGRTRMEMRWIAPAIVDRRAKAAAA